MLFSLYYPKTVVLLSNHSFYKDKNLRGKDTQAISLATDTESLHWVWGAFLCTAHFNRLEKRRDHKGRKFRDAQQITLHLNLHINLKQAGRAKSSKLFYTSVVQVASLRVSLHSPLVAAAVHLSPNTSLKHMTVKPRRSHKSNMVKSQFQTSCRIFRSSSLIFSAGRLRSGRGESHSLMADITPLSMKVSLRSCLKGLKRSPEVM